MWWFPLVAGLNRNRNRKLQISIAPTKAKSQGPAYSQALNQINIDRQRSRSRQSGRQTVRRLWWMVLGVETGREVWRRQWIRVGFAKEQCFQFGVKELCRDGQGRGVSELVGRFRYLPQCWREFVPVRRDSYGYGAIGKFEWRGDRRAE